MVSNKNVTPFNGERLSGVVHSANVRGGFTPSWTSGSTGGKSAPSCTIKAGARYTERAIREDPVDDPMTKFRAYISILREKKVSEILISVILKVSPMSYMEILNDTGLTAVDPYSEDNTDETAIETYHLTENDVKTYSMIKKMMTA